MMRILLAALAGVAGSMWVLGSGGSAQAVSRSECSLRQTICISGCNKDKSCERRCHTRYQQCMFKAE